ncbi:MAG: DUF2189 domain-containing protein [Gammaproteobacteria bacterium]|nr:DUF2189 domain-containing protein [Gammaproteobacteria bacterium]
MNHAALSPTRLTFGDIAASLREGAALARATRGVSMAYAAVFSAVGLILIASILALGLSPLVLPFAGGFMLIGPILLTGYFEMARITEYPAAPKLADAFAAFARAPRSLWLLALVCAFLFLIWITDAGVLYSFTLGGTAMDYGLDWLDTQRDDLLSFLLWGSLMGSLLAYMIFTISAFSVPLVYERRATLVQAVSASAHAVIGNFLVCLVWGVVLGSVIVFSVIVLPMLLLTLPVMSYASFALYRRAFPYDEKPTADAD